MVVEGPVGAGDVLGGPVVLSVHGVLGPWSTWRFSLSSHECLCHFLTDFIVKTL